MNAFRSFQVIKEPVFHTAISDLPFTELAENEVLVKIAYSDVNYKDALAMSESGQVIRTYPMTPGIDLSGTVVQSNNPRFSKEDLVLATGFGLGVTHPGGYSQYQKVPGDWLVPLPKKYDAASSDDPWYSRVYCYVVCERFNPSRYDLR
ncbi:hypothetical protein EfmAA96_06520 [Enterococcus faecium]|nr:hypothetical protein EfmAA96_06520 [Enterococcus faecium]